MVYAKAQVCCTFVCKMWKHAGVFGDLADKINCNELTNTDNYKMNIFEKNF